MSDTHWSVPGPTLTRDWTNSGWGSCALHAWRTASLDCLEDLGRRQGERAAEQVSCWLWSSVEANRGGDGPRDAPFVDQPRRRGPAATFLWSRLVVIRIRIYHEPRSRLGGRKESPSTQLYFRAFGFVCEAGDAFRRSLGDDCFSRVLQPVASSQIGECPAMDDGRFNQFCLWDA